LFIALILSDPKHRSRKVTNIVISTPKWLKEEIRPKDVATHFHYRILKVREDRGGERQVKSKEAENIFKLVAGGGE
jgi:hypothetical protein